MKRFVLLYIILAIGLIITLVKILINKENSKINFVTVEYQGELGNKLFQTATAFAYAKEHNLKLILPIKSRSSKSLRKMLSRLNFEKVPKNPQIINETSSPYIYQKLPKGSNCCLKGFFISKKYFSKYQDDIKALFKISKPLRFSLQKKYPKIFNHNCTVALHVRTFLKDLKNTGNKLYEIYPAPDLKYIRNAIKHFPANALFVVCSDNIAWAKIFLKNLNRKFLFIEGQKNFEDLYLMSLCDHMITSNSTFSWWAAFLNNNPHKKIIVRSPWIMKIKSKIEDIVPDDWIIIEGDRNAKIPQFF